MSVHEHLLDGRALRIGTIHHVEQTQHVTHTVFQGDAHSISSRISDAQKTFLFEQLAKTKKTKYAFCFLTPVDPVALNIPGYPEVIKQPMDLGTTTTELENDQYSSVKAFDDDLGLIVSNSKNFNGPTHKITR